MSTTVIPHGADGQWVMQTVTASEARALAAAGFTSAVGHASSAEAMSAALNLAVEANRLTVTPQPGDVFLCMRLHRRPPEGVILDAAQLEAIGFSWCTLSYFG